MRESESCSGSENKKRGGAGEGAVDAVQMTAEAEVEAAVEAEAVAEIISDTTPRPKTAVVDRLVSRGARYLLTTKYGIEM